MYLRVKETKHWFLPLDKHEAFLREWILEGHKKDWKPNVYGQVKSWVEDGLRPRAVTRDLDWGIPVPVEGARRKSTCMFGLMHLLDTFHRPKNGRQEKEKTGKIIGKKTIPNWFILLGKTTLFFTVLFFQRC